MYLCYYVVKKINTRVNISTFSVFPSHYTLSMLYLDYCEMNRSIFGKESLISKVKNLISFVNLCTYVVKKINTRVNIYTFSVLPSHHTLCVCSV